MELIFSSRYDALAKRPTETFDWLIASQSNFISRPVPSSSPILSSWVRVKPPVTGNCRAMSAFFVTRFQ